MKLTKMHIVIIMAAALVLGFVGAYGGVLMAQPDNDSGQQEGQIELPAEPAEEGNDKAPPEDVGKVTQAFQLIKENYLEEVDDQQLIEGAIQGMLTTLEDPYSSYMDVEMMDEFNEQIESSFEGIGAEVSMINGAVTIVSPIKDSPAERAGLRPNDQVLTVDDESVEGLDLNEAVAKIRGEKGSEVTLGILRPGSSEPFDVTIVRDTIPVETVYSETENIDGKLTGILEITNFSEQTAEEFTEQLEQMENEGMEGLIIDVRGNPGGLLNVVEDILKLFIPADVPYLQIEDQNGDTMPYYSQLDEEKDYPISVIIDEGSASASEILAVAMKEMGHDVVGQPSFGKGTVQQAVPMGDGSSIKLTFYKWLSPNGEWIHETGVEPTIDVKQPDYYYTNPVQIEEPLTYDQADERIASVQLMLDGLGYEPGRTDGYFDAATIDAVTAFQEEHDLESTGEIDQDTAGLIEAELVEHIRNGEDDQQLEKALQEIYK
ncbi:S41 family peptidase [Virgibacillus sp. YIM 98842]|jgi:carboxyl-terminal processing protease|uniref:S41 family peptidase n=1 Tax=Virgibacillus sp. YIM 98842 TaxID=2663533 RepID=UPI0013D99B13|nr:S41 family peptidase [Virgibacillus sp. YIM 98842]